MTRSLLICLSLCLALPLLAQDFGYGFKAGLSFNTMNGPLEEDASGNAVEEITGNRGFHVGFGFTWKATELMGLRGELMYSQRGANREFEGPSYYTFYGVGTDPTYTTGTRKQSVNTSLSYLELPITGYVKPLDWLELHVGASIGLLAGASGFGDFRYNGMTSTGASIEEIAYELDFNYLNNEAGSATFANPPETVRIKGEDIPYPQLAGAYYEFKDGRGKFFNPLDFGLIGGLSIYFSKGLYVSGRLNYGISDVTKSRADVSLVKLDGTEFISRNDDDTNFSIQTSVGFSF